MDDKQLQAIEERADRYCSTIEEYRQAEQDRDDLLAEVKRLRDFAEKVKRDYTECDKLYIHIQELQELNK